MISIWTHLKRYPPYVVRLLARKGGRNIKALSDVEISQRSGLPLSTVVCIYHQSQWDHISVSQMEQFTRACGLDFGDSQSMKRINHYARVRRSSKWAYLRRSPDWETLYLPLIERWKTSYVAS